MNLEPETHDIDDPEYRDPEQTPIPPSQAAEVFTRLDDDDDYGYDDYDDDYDDDDDDYDDDYGYDDYGEGYDNAAAYASASASGYDNAVQYAPLRLIFVARISRKWTHLKWKWHDFRRAIKGIKTDNSDIPF